MLDEMEEEEEEKIEILYILIRMFVHREISFIMCIEYAFPVMTGTINAASLKYIGIL